MIELVALDMAGTTIDEHGDVYRALHEAVMAEGADVTAGDIQHWMGAEKRAAITALIELAVGERPSEAVVDRTFDRFRQMLADAYRDNPPIPIAGVPEAFAALRADGVAVALTTGFSRDVAHPLLQSLGWDSRTVDAVVCGDEVAAGRPAPYMIFRAMEATGVMSVDRVLVAGDTVVDLRAGVNGGVAAVVGVGTGKLGLEALGRERHTHLLPSVADLPDLVSSLNKEGEPIGGARPIMTEL